jgi:hypothetical protein
LSPYRIFRMLLLRWHRRIGVALAAFLTMLVLTGIAINHSAEWGLDKKPLRQTWLLQHYGLAVPSLRSFAVSNRWLSQLGDSLYLDHKSIGGCDGDLLSASVFVDGLAVLCQGRLQLFTADGMKLDDISESLGLPVDVDGLASGQQTLLLRTPARVFSLDPISLMFTDLGELAEVSWSTPGVPPTELQQGLAEQYQGSGISWERLLLDLHSGRLFGKAGVLITDIAAIFLLLIALSGVWVWVSKPGRWRKR